MIKPAHALSLISLALALGPVGMAADTPEPGTEIEDCEACPTMIVVPPGEFMMGTPLGSREIDLTRGEGPQVRITIDYAFAVGRTNARN